MSPSGICATVIAVNLTMVYLHTGLDVCLSFGTVSLMFVLCAANGGQTAATDVNRKPVRFSLPEAAATDIQYPQPTTGATAIRYDKAKGHGSRR